MVGVFGAKMTVYFRPRDWDKSWKFLIVTDSLEWVWGLPSDGLDCVCVIVWAIPRWTVGLFISPCELILCHYYD